MVIILNYYLVVRSSCIHRCVISFILALIVFATLFDLITKYHEKKMNRENVELMNSKVNGMTNLAYAAEKSDPDNTTAPNGHSNPNNYHIAGIKTSPLKQPDVKLSRKYMYAGFLYR